jgi:hypothetical protein
VGKIILKNVRNGGACVHLDQSFITSELRKLIQPPYVMHDVNVYIWIEGREEHTKLEFAARDLFGRVESYELYNICCSN